MSAPASTLIRLDLPTAVGPHSMTTSSVSSFSSRRSPPDAARFSVSCVAVAASVSPRSCNAAAQAPARCNVSTGSTELMRLPHRSRSCPHPLAQAAQIGGQASQQALVDVQRPDAGHVGVADIVERLYIQRVGHL